MIIEIHNEAGQLAIAYKVYRCWVSEYQALPDLDANANTVLIEHLKLESEGWERDESVTEPPEPRISPSRNHPNNNMGRPIGRRKDVRSISQSNKCVSDKQRGKVKATS